VRSIAISVSVYLSLYASPFAYLKNHSQNLTKYSVPVYVTCGRGSIASPPTTLSKANFGFVYDYVSKIINHIVWIIGIPVANALPGYKRLKRMKQF